jgi:hypothetical protein
MKLMDAIIRKYQHRSLTRLRDERVLEAIAALGTGPPNAVAQFVPHLIKILARPAAISQTIENENRLSVRLKAARLALEALLVKHVSRIDMQHLEEASLLPDWELIDRTGAATYEDPWQTVRKDIGLAAVRAIARQEISRRNSL